MLAPELKPCIGGYFLDFYWPMARLAVELDGFARGRPARKDRQSCNGLLSPTLSSRGGEGAALSPPEPRLTPLCCPNLYRQ